MGLSNLFGKKEKGQPSPMPRPRLQQQRSWVVQSEHFILRVVSLIFSFGSAYAIAQVFAPPVVSDYIRQGVDIGIAIGFGVLGYFLSRSIAYRMMQKQPIWAYIPICLVVEFVEIFCNYVLGVSEVPHEQWLHAIPANQQGFISNMAYVVLSIIPAVTIFLAVADMDLERRKEHGAGQAGPVPSNAWASPASSKQASSSNVSSNAAPTWTNPAAQNQPRQYGYAGAAASNGANPLPGVP